MIEFGEMFETLTGHKPLKWQCRLYSQWLVNDIKPVIDLPTGMGKTYVMAIWLIARAARPQGDPLRLPTRLVYVVDRRTVVDQATTLAENLAIEAKIDAPAISTLRGQFADNREWTRDLSKPAIIIGTVDMIGSRLLFSGYRSSYKQRPLDAGLLGQDSLLILDEAHLSEPFEKLLEKIEHEGPFQRGQGLPMRVVRMSATTGKSNGNRFQLESSDLEGDRESNLIVRRYEAQKHLHIHENLPNIQQEIIKKAADLAADNSRVVVFVRSPDDATKIADGIRKSKDKIYKDSVEILTGTMRGLERDELLNKPVMKRFLDAKNSPNEGRAILVSTSAGEVGFDLNADHLFCDAAPLDSIIQRLGRVNRRGNGVAEVHLFAGKPKEGNKKSTGKKEQESAPAHTYETASAKTLEILKQLPKLPDGSMDASPKAFADIEKPLKALTPKPTIVELTDILLDAWSMTTIVEPMPGRPPVADWIRGIADDMPQTTIAWRAELDVNGFGDLDIADIEEWFDAHRILPHETLTAPTTKALEWLTARWEALDDQTKEKIGVRPCIIDRGGLQKVELKELADSVKNKQRNDLLNADIILPASFGGINKDGLLCPEEPKIANENGAGKSPDVADEPGSNGSDRHRRLKTGESEVMLLGGDLRADSNLCRFMRKLPADDDDDDIVRQLISLAPKKQRPDFGTEEQLLCKHVDNVVCHADRIAKELKLPAIEQKALLLAAKWHDNGKKREIWQRAVGGDMQCPLGKSGGRMGYIAGNYRHEFGSLREFIEGNGGNRDPEIFDLAAHLIATHHGRARPHFPKGGFDPDARAKSPEIATEAMRRFARLQRKYGHWRLAWLENLLRCADALASAENDGRKNK